MEGLNQNEKIIWTNWKTKTCREVVREAAAKGFCINLAHKYLMHHNSWDEKTAIEWFQSEVFAWVLQLLSNKQIFKAKHVLNKVNICPEQHLLNLARESAEISFRDYIVDQLMKTSGEFQSKNTEEWRLFTLHWKLLKCLEQSFELGGTFKQNKVFGLGKDLIVVTETEIRRLTIESIEKYPESWKCKVASYLFFETFEFQLLEFLNPDYVWSHLIDHNKGMILIRWINMYFSEVVRDINARFNFFNNDNFVTKLLTVDAKSLDDTKLKELDTVFRKWVISQEMIDKVAEKDCFLYTKLCIYDALCSYGIVIEDEKNNLTAIISRLARTRNLKIIDEIFSEDCATMSKNNFYTNIADYCLSNNLFKVLTSVCDTHFEYETASSMSDDVKRCLQLLFMFKDIEQGNPKLLSLAVPIYKTCELISNGSLSEYLTQNPLIILSLIIMSEDLDLFDIFNVDKSLIVGNTVVTWNEPFDNKLPHLKEVYLKFKDKSLNVRNDVNVYQLLSGYRGLDILKLFEFQMESHSHNAVLSSKGDRRSLGSLLSAEISPKGITLIQNNLNGLSDIPHFGNPKLVKKFGYVAKLNYLYYLKQNRPCMASQAFVTQQYNAYNKLTDRGLKDACCETHALALQNWNDSIVTATCISFMTMIGSNATRCRTHVTASNMIKMYLVECEKRPLDITVKLINDLMIQLSLSNEVACLQILRYLEKATAFIISEKIKVKENKGIDITLLIYEWQTAVKFAILHGLPLPEVQLLELVEKKCWLPFLLFGDVFRYPQAQMLQLSQKFADKAISDHLKHIILHRPNEDINIQERDANRPLHKDGQRKLSRHSSVENSPTHNISFEYPDGNKWSDDLWEVLTTCHDAEDPPGALIKASHSLKCPLLALIATCYEPNAVGVCWASWLVCTLGDHVQGESKFDFQWDISDQHPSEEQFHRLMEICIEKGYVRSLHESVLIFFPDSVLHGLTAFLCKTIWQLVFDAEGTELIRNFSRNCLRRYSTPGGSVTSVPWLTQTQSLQSIAVKLIKIAICQRFVSALHQRNFLKCLCDADFGNGFTVSGSINVKKLYDLITISMNTTVMLQFDKLFTNEYQEYLQHCVDVYIAEENFEVALSFAMIAGCSVDDILIAEWNAKYKAISTDASISDIDRCIFITKCSEAFKKAGVSPNETIAFLYKHVKEILDCTQKFYSCRILLRWFNEKMVTVDILMEKIEVEMWDAYLSSKCGSSIFLSEFDATTVFILNGQANVEVVNDTLIQYNFFSHTVNEIEILADVANITNVKELNPEFAEKWRCLINKLLDKKMFVDAFRVAAMFKLPENYKTRSYCPLILVKTCMKLAEHLVTPYDLPSELRLVISSPIHQRSLSDSETSNASFEELVVITLKADDMTEATTQLARREEADRLSAIEALAARGGSQVAKEISSLYRVALQIGWSYVNVLKFQGNRLEFMQYVSGRGRMALAKIVFRTFHLSVQKIAEFLCLEMVAAIVSPHLTKISGFRQKEHFRYTLWGYTLDSDMEMFLNMKPDACSLIGRMILDHLMAFRRIYKGHLAVESNDVLDDSPLDLDTLIDEEYQNVEEAEIESLMSKSVYTESGVTMSSQESEAMLSDTATTVYSYVEQSTRETKRNLFDVISNNNVHIPLQVKFNVRKITKGAKLSTKQVNVISIELLVLAHECFSSACDTEGIAIVLRSAQALTSQLLAAKSWRLMVRLLTGLARYTEMAYVFQMLRDNHQFEFLLGQIDYVLGQQQEKISNFKQGLLDFLKTHCPGDTETYYLVALHFTMYAEAADVKRKQANDLIITLEQMTLDSMKALARKQSLQPEWLVLHDTSSNRLLLDTAMEHCTNAAELYLRAGCMGIALKMAGLGQQVALQWALLNKSPTRFILNLSETKIYNLVSNYLSLMEGLVLVRATNGGGDLQAWRNVVYSRVLRGGDSQFIKDIAAYRLDVAVEILDRYCNESSTTPESLAAIAELRSLCR